MQTIEIDTIYAFEAAQRLRVGERLEQTGVAMTGRRLTESELDNVRKNRIVNEAVISGKFECLQKYYDDAESRWMYNGIAPSGTETGWLTLDKIASHLINA